MYTGQQKKKLRRIRRKKRRRQLARRIVLFAVVCLLVIGAKDRYRQLFERAGEAFSAKPSRDMAAMKKEIPQSLLTLMDKYPETEKFVLDYPAHKDDKVPSDISDEIKKGEIPHFLQWDERWGYQTYGSDFLAVTGCGPTCLAMVACGLLGDGTLTPYAVARMAQENGYYVDGAGSSWELMTAGAQKLGLYGEQLAFDERHILDALWSGQPVICAMRPGDFTTSGHFIVLKSADSDGNICVLDPNSRKNSEKRWTTTQLMPQIKNLWKYETIQ